MSYIRKIKEVESVTINFNNGWSKTINVKEEGIIALLWGNMEIKGEEKPSSAAVEILGTFYDSLQKKGKGITLSKEECKETFGKTRADKIYKSADEVKTINKELIEELWNTPDGNDDNLVFGGKGKICKIIGG